MNEVKIYIASKLINHADLNNQIHNKFKDLGIESFLPESISMHASTASEMDYVAEECFNQIDICDIILIVAPIGLSVASEVGYAICQKKMFKNKRLFLLNTANDKKVVNEAMIAPYIDKEFKTVNDLFDYFILSNR